MTLKQRIQRIRMLNTEGLKYLTQARKELKELEEATQDTFDKLHKDAMPELPFDDKGECSCGAQHGLIDGPYECTADCCRNKNKENDNE